MQVQQSHTINLPTRVCGGKSYDGPDGRGIGDFRPDPIRDVAQRGNQKVSIY